MNPIYLNVFLNTLEVFGIAGVLIVLILNRLDINFLRTKSNIVKSINDYDEITEMVKNRYEKIFNTIKECIIVLDERDIILECNKAVEEIFEWKKPEILGQNISILFKEKIIPGQNMIVIDCKTKNGREIAVDVSAVTTNLGFNKIICALCRDVTEQRETHKQISVLNDMLKTRVEALQMFQYTLFHDVNAPLQTIKGFSEIILEDYSKELPEEAKELLSKIKNSTKYLNQLVTDIMRFSELSDGKIQIKKEEFDLSKMAREICEKFVSDKIVELTIQPNMFCYSDKSLTEILLTNLISNAFNFSSKNDVIKIKIAQMKGAKDDSVSYYIKDNGIGFDMSKANLLFKPFSRLHNKKDYRGTGIGLSIVKQIVKLHDGEVWADSAPGSGAIFHFNLGEQCGQT